MSQLKAKQLKLSAAGDLLIGGTGGTGTTISASGNGDKILRVVNGAPAWDINDHLTSADGFNTVKATNGTGIVVSVANAAGTAAVPMLTFASGSASDENLKVSTSAGAVTISGQGSAADVDVIIAPQGNGDVIIGNAGGGIIQAEDGEDLALQGGNGGGNLFLLGGDPANGGSAGKIYYAGDSTDPTKEIATIGNVAQAVAAATVSPYRSEFTGTQAFVLNAKTLNGSVIAYVNGSLIEAPYFTYTANTQTVTFNGSLPYTLDSSDQVVFTYEITA